MECLPFDSIKYKVIGVFTFQYVIHANVHTTNAGWHKHFLTVAKVFKR